jgi:Family of unknown function (DUF6544)
LKEIDMLRILQIILAIAVGIHGLIHLLGFVAYWPLAKVVELPYKTSLLGGRLELGAGGMRLYSALWLLSALGFVIAAIALATKWPSWAPLMLGAVLLSIVVCIPDWGAAFRGVWIDVVLLLVLVIVFGLRVQPAPFDAYTAAAAPVQTVPLPAGLPEPVERFYRQKYGDEVPVYHSAVITGRGTLRFMGITFPARWRFTHEVGKAYRHYFETTFYGFPVLRVNEHYLDGHSRLELPFGVEENEPGVDSAANQGLWAETSAFPSVFLTDPSVRWEAVDDTSARLYVPFGEDTQEFTVTFDPQTGELVRMETLRYYDEKVGKLRWLAERAQVRGHDGQPTTTLAATWEGEGTPWLVCEIEEAVFNADVSAYIRQKGP